MNPQSELGEFLRLRRAGIQPDDVGLLHHGVRRVPGLRREELAMLAGVSLTYYTRLEQGLSTNASDAVLDSLARALRLSADERIHLFDLARPTKRPGRRRPARPDAARPGTIRLVQAMTGVPAVVLGRLGDVLAWNPLGHRLVAGHLDFEAPAVPETRPNLHRLLFLDPHTRELYSRWPEEASRAVASLRLLAGRADDGALAALIGELTLHSEEFARLWSRHPVQNCVSGVKLLKHPELGELELSFEVLDSPDDSGHRILLYTAEPGSPAEESLKLLGILAGSTGNAVPDAGIRPGPSSRPVV
ncbi:helix-turn-helix domain-containing protein [Arthrobacter sp. RCC_34]|uniref:helix-turn-helix domain-containing protein n=1 Tax=Arthrobacter sp. RCC_34 TaxID=3239230 RepID=UPI0035263AA7